jgi:hypothetical protein
VVLVTLQIVEAPVMRIAGRVDAKVSDAELGPDFVIAVVARPDLCSYMHELFSLSLTACYTFFFRLPTRR